MSMSTNAVKAPAKKTRGLPTKRIIPLFLLKGDRLAKGTNFRDFTDVGDPVSQGMVFDAQGAEEIAIVDITAASENRLIPSAVINSMITKCKLPIAAGGGIKTVDDARECFQAGADKIIINTYAVLTPQLVSDMASEFGSQSVLVSLDVKRSEKGEYRAYVYSGTREVETPLLELVEMLVDRGAGELMVTSIDREGTLSGLDLELYELLRNRVSVPLIASGGAGSYDHLVNLFKGTDCDAVALGKMLFLRDYDIVRIKSYLLGRHVTVREA